jgi:hypothetical protein
VNQVIQLVSSNITYEDMNKFSGWTLIPRYWLYVAGQTIYLQFRLLVTTTDPYHPNILAGELSD